METSTRRDRAFARSTSPSSPSPSASTTVVNPSPPTPGPPRTRTGSAVSPAPVTKYRRGDIWFVTSSDKSMPVGTELWPNRPAVIVSNNVSSNKSGFVQVVYLTTSARKRSGPTHVEVGTPLPDGKESMALCEQIHTIDTSRLTRRLGAVAQHYMPEIDAALSFSLSIGHTDDYGLFKKWEQYIKTYGIDLPTEIAALSAQTTDARVESLTRAIENLAAERDSLRQLFKTSAALPAILKEVRTAMSPDSGQEDDHPTSQDKAS